MFVLAGWCAFLIENAVMLMLEELNSSPICSAVLISRIPEAYVRPQWQYYVRARL